MMSNIELLAKRRREDEEKKELLYQKTNMVGFLLSLIMGVVVYGSAVYQGLAAGAILLSLALIACMGVMTAIMWFLTVICLYGCGSILIDFLDRKTGLNYFHGRTKTTIGYASYQANDTTYYVWENWNVWAEGKETSDIVFVDHQDVHTYPEESPNEQLSYFLCVPGKYMGGPCGFVHIPISQKQYLQLSKAECDGAALALTEEEFLEAADKDSVCVNPIVLA